MVVVTVASLVVVTGVTTVVVVVLVVMVMSVATKRIFFCLTWKPCLGHIKPARRYIKKKASS